jgi:hypothetical protein
MKALVWLVVLGFLWYTGLLQMLLVMTGAFIMWVAALITTVGGL